jgi:acyl-CoA dehydrogenase
VTEELSLLEETIRSIFVRHWTPVDRQRVGSSLPDRVWSLLDEAGLTALGSPDSGAGLAEAIVLAREVGRAAVPVPLVEMSGLAAWLLGSGGLELGSGITTSAVCEADDDLRAVGSGDGWSVTGTLHRVPWGHLATAVAAVAQTDDGPIIVRLPPADHVDRHTNLAGEPRDTLRYGATRLMPGSFGSSAVDLLQFRRRGALLRAASMVGAMEAVLTMSIAYASERRQFGRPISSFSAVQDHLVLMAEEISCAAIAVAAAALDPQPTYVAAAKLAAGEAAEVVASRAHQVHGAIGVTIEHALHHFTKRLWSWQADFGSTDAWSATLGEEIIAGGADWLWPAVSAALADGTGPISSGVPT